MIDYQDLLALAALALGIWLLQHPAITVRRRGGLRFWRIGRLGGCFYLARRRAPQ